MTRSQSSKQNRVALFSFVSSYLFILALMVGQFWWLYYDELIGKEVGMGGYTAFSFLSALSMSAIALPLAAAICGAVEYRMACCANTGPLRLRRLVIRASGFAIAAFFLAAFLVPPANLRSLSLLYSIRNAAVGEPLQKTDLSLCEDAPMAQNIIELYTAKWDLDYKIDSIRQQIITSAGENIDEQFKASFFTDSLLQTLNISRESIAAAESSHLDVINDNNSIAIIHVQDYGVQHFKLKQLQQFIIQPFRQALLALLLFISGAFLGIWNRRNKLLLLVIGMWFVWIPVVYVGDNYLKKLLYAQKTHVYFTELASCMLLAVLCAILYAVTTKSLRTVENISIFDLQKND